VARAASCCISREQRRRPTARREAPLWKGLLPFRKSAWRAKSFAWSRCTMKRSNACIVRYRGWSRGWKDATRKFMLLLRDDKVIESRVSVYEGTWGARCQRKFELSLIGVLLRNFLTCHPYLRRAAARLQGNINCPLASSRNKESCLLCYPIMVNQVWLIEAKWNYGSR